MDRRRTTVRGAAIIQEGPVPLRRLAWKVRSLRRRRGGQRGASFFPHDLHSPIPRSIFTLTAMTLSHICWSTAPSSGIDYRPLAGVQFRIMFGKFFFKVAPKRSICDGPLLSSLFIERGCFVSCKMTNNLSIAGFALCYERVEPPTPLPFDASRPDRANLGQLVPGERPANLLTVTLSSLLNTIQELPPLKPFTVIILSVALSRTGSW